jgi:hypothetical protein
MRLVSTTNITNNTVTYNFPSGQQIGCVMVVYDVITAGGNTASLASCGNVRLNWTGEDLINVPARIISLANNLYGGVAETLLAAAGSNRIAIFLTPGLTYDSKTVYDIGQSDNVSLTLDFTALAALSASGTVKIYVKDKIGTMSYVHKMLPKFCIAQSAGVVPDTIPVNNISELYLDDPAANLVTGVQVIKDNITVVDSNSILDLQAYNNWIHLVETAITNVLALDLAESKDLREVVGGSLAYRITFSGGATLPLYYGFCSYTGQKLLESQNRASKMLAMKVSNSIS